MADGFRYALKTKAGTVEYDHVPETDQSFENALATARDGDRLSVADAVELLTTGTDSRGIDRERKEAVTDLANRRRAAMVGDEVTFVANVNNNVTTACGVGCRFCNYSDPAAQFMKGKTNNSAQPPQGADPPQATDQPHSNAKPVPVSTVGGPAAGEMQPSDGKVRAKPAAEDRLHPSAQQTERTDQSMANRGFTKTPAESRVIVEDALDRGVSEVTTVSGLHPAMVLDEDHREMLEGFSERNSAHPVTYRPPDVFETDPGTYREQIDAMAIDGVHVHGVTPEEAAHAARGTDWDFETVYQKLTAAGLDSVPGTAAEILVPEVRAVICPGKIDSQTWLDAMEGAAAAGLPVTATMLYGHVENAMHRAMHLKKIRDLADRTGAITEFVPLSFVHENTALYEQGYVDGGASRAEDELLVAVARLFLDSIPNIQASWVKHGDEAALSLLECGANDFMGTCLSEEITSRAGGTHGNYRTVADYVEMITDIDRIPVERSTDYSRKAQIDPNGDQLGPVLGPRADGTPLL